MTAAGNGVQAPTFNPNQIVMGDQMHPSEQNFFESIDDPELDEPDSANLLQLVKDEIVNQLHLSENVSEALTPAFV